MAQEVDPEQIEIPIGYRDRLNEANSSRARAIFQLLGSWPWSLVPRYEPAEWHGAVLEKFLTLARYVVTHASTPEVTRHELSHLIEKTVAQRLTSDSAGDSAELRKRDLETILDKLITENSTESPTKLIRSDERSPPHSRGVRTGLRASGSDPNFTVPLALHVTVQTPSPARHQFQTPTRVFRRRRSPSPNTTRSNKRMRPLSYTSGERFQQLISLDTQGLLESLSSHSHHLKNTLQQELVAPQRGRLTDVQAIVTGFSNEIDEMLVSLDNQVGSIKLQLDALQASLQEMAREHRRCQDHVRVLQVASDAAQQNHQQTKLKADELGRVVAGLRQLTIERLTSLAAAIEDHEAKEWERRQEARQALDTAMKMQVELADAQRAAEDAEQKTKNIEARTQELEDQLNMLGSDAKVLKQIKTLILQENVRLPSLGEFLQSSQSARNRVIGSDTGSGSGE